MDESTEWAASCSDCGETIYRTGNLWPHANGLLICPAKGRAIAARRAAREERVS